MMGMPGNVLYIIDLVNYFHQWIILTLQSEEWNQFFNELIKLK